jgi:hypothetical protein
MIFVCSLFFLFLIVFLDPFVKNFIVFNFILQIKFIVFIFSIIIIIIMVVVVVVVVLVV